MRKRPRLRTLVDDSDVRRITLKIISFILIFSTHPLPISLGIGYLNLRVDSYFLNPLRCFQCQQFGYHKDNCKNSSDCVKCCNLNHNIVRQVFAVSKFRLYEFSNEQNLVVPIITSKITKQMSVVSTVRDLTLPSLRT